MQQFKQNIISIFGEKGERWISNLSTIVEILTNHWKLNHLTPVDNMTFNYVAKATTNTNQPVVLKISCDEKSITDEKQALIYFKGKGSIELLDYHAKYHALLLQQAVPGIALHAYYPSQIPFVMDCYIATMNKLHDQPLSHTHHYRHISEWLEAIDQLAATPFCFSELLEKAIHLKNKLLSTMTKHLFLHGDLHHDNILKHGNEWLAIDPKGIVGEPEFEIAAFDFMNIAELGGAIEIKNKFESRINLLAQKAHLDSQRIKDWVFVRLMLMAAWQVEDQCDSQPAFKLAKKLFS